MAKKTKEPQHIVEFRLNASKSDLRKFNIRLEIGRRLYNASLAEIFRRNAIMRSTPEWAKLIKDYRETKAELSKLQKIKKTSKAELPEISVLEKQKKQLSKSFQDLRKEHGVSEYALNRYSTECRKGCYFSKHLDANTVQKIDNRVMKAFDRWAFGIGGKPRFKGKNRALRSLEGKTNKQGIVIRVGNELKGTVTRVIWNSMVMPLILDKIDKHGYQSAALQLIAENKVSFVRIIKRTYKCSERLYAQLVLKGSPFVKAFHREAFTKAKGKRVGLDLGVSSLAYYGQDKAELLLGVGELLTLTKKIKKHEKRASRLLRLANHQNYNKVKRRVGRKERTVWQRKKKVRDNVRSNHYQREIAKVKELHRKIAAKRKYLHDVYANKVVSQGNVILTETVSVKAWQKIFGKSVNHFAPSSLISTIKRKAENADGQIIQINTWKAKLSQYNHVLNENIKKKLSDRIMVVGDCVVQRDLYSAFLAYCVDESTNQVNQSIALKEWSGARLRLDAAFEEIKLRAKGTEYLPSSAGVHASP